MENKNSLYNRNVAEIFIALVKCSNLDFEGLTQGELEQFADVAKILCVNQPQVY